MLQVGEINSAGKARFLTETNKEIVLQFNPSEYEFSEEARYSAKEKDKMNTSLPQYMGSRSKTFHISLNFDTSSIQDVKGTSRAACSVKSKTDEIEALAKMENSLHRPPAVDFIWGEIKFSGYVISVKTTFTLFHSDGVPIRAKVDVVMQEMPGNKKKNAKESPDRTKTRVLSEDVTIWELARREYGDMKEWRRIAKANEILNPFEVEIGRILQVPAITENE